MIIIRNILKILYPVTKKKIFNEVNFKLASDASLNLAKLKKII